MIVLSDPKHRGAFVRQRLATSLAFKGMPAEQQAEIIKEAGEHVEREVRNAIIEMQISMKTAFNIEFR